MSPAASHDVVSPWIALGVYAAGFAVTARVFFYTSPDGDGEDRLAAILFGLFWPLALLFAVAVGLLALPTLGVKTKADRWRLAAERAEAAKREREELDTRIAELEAENDRLRRDAP